MRDRIELLAVSGLLFFCASSWVIVFIQITDGKVFLHEPDNPWLLGEIAVAFLFTCIGAYGMLRAFRRLL